MWDWDNELFDEMELTSRQGEVLKLKRKGMTSRAMAKELGLGKTLKRRLTPGSTIPRSV